MRSFLSFAISCFYSLFLAKLKRIPIYPFAPCTGPQIMVESKLFPPGICRIDNRILLFEVCQVLAFLRR